MPYTDNIYRRETFPANELGVRVSVSVPCHGGGAVFRKDLCEASPPSKKKKKAFARDRDQRQLLLLITSSDFNRSRIYIICLFYIVHERRFHRTVNRAPTSSYIRDPSDAKFRVNTSFVERFVPKVFRILRGRTLNIIYALSSAYSLSPFLSYIIESRVNRTHKSTADMTTGYVGRRRRGNRIIIKYRDTVRQTM